jgi:(R,R)-butanediol dehydrogenase / meso-butanediol dehydrogenase / diacetyl reductase
MRAAVLKARGRIDIDRAYPSPSLKATDLLLRVGVSGICGSDLHEFVAGPLALPMPAVLGHEFCGEVVEVGAEVRGFEKGDKAVGIIYPGCGSCEYCRRGVFTLCDMRAMAVAERNGSFAEYITAPARQMFLVPAATPEEEVALIEPSSVACHAIRRSGLTVGHRVLVMGAGPIGLLVTALARLGGADRIAVVEPGAGRRDLALRMGADVALDPSDEVDGPVMELTESRGADIVFEASGNPTAFNQAQHLVRKQGRIVMVAVYEGRKLELRANRLVGNEIDLLASYWADDVDFQRAVSLVASRKLDVRPLISARYDLDDIQKAFEALAADRGSFGKILVTCS